MTDTRMLLARRLSEERQKTTDFFSGIKPEEWSIVLYSDGAEWNVKQLLAHIVASEQGNLTLIEDILRGGSGSPERFELNRFNQERVRDLQDIPHDDLIVMFQTYRKKLIDLVQKLDNQDLGKIGRNPYLGVAQIEDIIKLVYRHVQIHLRDARRLVEQATKEIDPSRVI